MLHQLLFFRYFPLALYTFVAAVLGANGDQSFVKDGNNYTILAPYAIARGINDSGQFVGFLRQLFERFPLQPWRIHNDRGSLGHHYPSLGYK
jgi:hypothetical protein